MKAHTVIETQVPCAFSKKGTHYFKLVLDSWYNIKYVSCECEEQSGPTVMMFEQARETGAPPTCYRPVLNIRENRNGARFSRNSSMLFSHATQLVDTAMDLAGRRFRSRLSTHNPETELVIFRIRRWAAVLNNFIQSATCNLTLSVDWFHVSDPRIQLNMMSGHSISGVLASYSPINGRLKLTKSHFSKFEPLDTFDPSKVWQHVNVSLSQPNLDTEGEQKPKFCYACMESFERLSKHVQSTRHANKIRADMAKAVSLFSPAGIAALNKLPLHRFVPKLSKREREIRTDRLQGVATKWVPKDLVKLYNSGWENKAAELLTAIAPVTYYEAHRVFKQFPHLLPVPKS